MSRYAIQIFGNVRQCRTEAEISRVTAGGSSDEVAAVFETSGGWEITVYDDGIATNPDEGFKAAVEQAKETLRHYVNRRGENPPEGLTDAGLSFWLMEKDDGTAMGAQVNQ